MGNKLGLSLKAALIYALNRRLVRDDLELLLLKNELELLNKDYFLISDIKRALYDIN